MDKDAILAWHRQGMSFAEIGHRVGVSGDEVRRMLMEKGAIDADALGDRVDDSGPNAAEVR